MNREVIAKKVKGEFDINLFFYSRESNANNLCGTYNIFLNDKLSYDEIFLLLESLILEIEKSRNENDFNYEESSKRISALLKKLKGGES